MYLKKYINLLSKLFCCFAFALLVCFTLNYDDIKKSNAYINDNVVTAYDDITDLTGYTFTFNSGFGAPYGFYDITFYSNDEYYEALQFAEFNMSDDYPPDPEMNVYELRYDTYVVCSGSFAYLDNWVDDNYRVINIVGGVDSTNSELISLFSSGSIGTLEKNSNSYNISINLGDGLYGSTSATIEENSTITLTYSVLNNGVFGGYVFDYGQNLVSNKVGDGHISATGGYDEIVLTIDNVTSDLSFNINSVAGQSMIGKWYLDYNLYLNSDLQSIDIADVLRRPFTSNGLTFNRIYRNTNLNTFVYDYTEDYERPIVNVFSFLTGLYLPVDTYNYLLIDIASDPSGLSYDYVPSSFMFFKFFRPATSEDIARVNQLNEHLIIQKENTNFVSLFGAILDTQFGTLKSLLNFYIFDINIWSLVTFFLTIILIFIVFKVIKGGNSDGKKS